MSKEKCQGGERKAGTTLITPDAVTARFRVTPLPTT